MFRAFLDFQKYGSHNQNLEFFQIIYTQRERERGVGGGVSMLSTSTNLVLDRDEYVWYQAQT